MFYNFRFIKECFFHWFSELMSIHSVTGVRSGPPGDPFECRSLDPLHQSAAGHTRHEPAWVAHTDSQVDKYIYTHTVHNKDFQSCGTNFQSQPSVCLRTQWQQQVWTSTQTDSGTCTLSGRRSRGTWGMLQPSWTESSKSPPRCTTPTTTSKIKPTPMSCQNMNIKALFSVITILAIYVLPPPFYCPLSGSRPTWVVMNLKKCFLQRSMRSWGHCAVRRRRQNALNRPRRRRRRGRLGRKNLSHPREQTR